jgi:hypothetical protein
MELFFLKFLIRVDFIMGRQIIQNLGVKIILILLLLALSCATTYAAYSSKCTDTQILPLHKFVSTNMYFDGDSLTQGNWCDYVALNFGMVSAYLNPAIDNNRLANGATGGSNMGKVADRLARTWQSGTKYMMGKVVRPTIPNNYTYLAINGGITGTLEPSWNTTVDGKTIDGTIVWECFHETRPLCDGLYSNDFDSNFAILWIGTNDIGNNRPVKDIENAIQAWHIARKAVGWKTITYTILPRTDKKILPMTDTIFESRRVEINSWIRSTYQHWSDGLVDVAADSRLQDPNNTTYFCADKIHPIGEGLKVVISLTCKTIEEIVDISNCGNNNVSNLNKSDL